MSSQIQEPLRFSIAGQDRDIPAGLWAKLTGPLPLPPYPCDGCSYSPDYIGGSPIWAACLIHDFHYREAVFGPDGYARKRADDILFSNIVTISFDYGTGLIRTYLRAWIYWGQVRIWGRSAYRRGAGAIGDMPIWERVLEVWFVCCR